VSFTPSRAESFQTARREAYDRVARWLISRLERAW